MMWDEGDMPLVCEVLYAQNTVKKKDPKLGLNKVQWKNSRTQTISIYFFRIIKQKTSSKWATIKYNGIIEGS